MLELLATATAANEDVSEKARRFKAFEEEFGLPVCEMGAWVHGCMGA